MLLSSVPKLRRLPEASLPQPTVIASPLASESHSACVSTKISVCVSPSAGEWLFEKIWEPICRATTSSRTSNSCALFTVISTFAPTVWMLLTVLLCAYRTGVRAAKAHIAIVPAGRRNSLIVNLQSSELKPTTFEPDFLFWIAQHG